MPQSVIEQATFRRLLFRYVGLPLLVMTLLAAGLIWRLQTHVLLAGTLVLGIGLGLINWRHLFLLSQNYEQALRVSQEQVEELQRQATALEATLTAYQQGEETLRESEALYRTLGEAVPDFIWACRADGYPLFVNQRWTEYTGVTLEQAMQKQGHVFHHPEDLPRIVEMWKRLAITPERYEIEYRYRRRDGVYRWFMDRAAPVQDAQGRVVQWIGTTTDIHERKQAEEALRESEEQSRVTFEQAAVGIAQVSADFQWLRVNPKLCEILGYSREELFRCSFQEITHPDDLGADRAQAHRMLAGEISNYSLETRNIRKDGSVVWIHLTVSLVREPTGEPRYFISIIEDITVRKRLENQLLQAQKLESVGRLAGGVANDFNNLLTVIQGFAELIQEECVLESTAQVYLENIQLASEKASDLTRQLLAFARRQVIEPKIVNLNNLLLILDMLLRRLIGENIELVMLPQDGLHTVKVDPGQFEQILFNLVVNARDAMPNGGKILIETSNVVLDAEYAQRHEDVVPGEYVMLAISDTGAGMEEAVRLHIFEPFFTTKEQGRGTGLGLATVYGIVKQVGGHIWLYSEPGEGTTFKIYLPRTTALPDAPIAPPHLADTHHGSELILLVEDEAAVRALALQALRGRGYEVLEAMNGTEALQVAAGKEHAITLLITDVVMPQMNGKDLADRLQAIHPALIVLYVSGYTENTSVHHGVLEAGTAFLSKPFTPTTLTAKVRELLDAAQTSP